MNRSTQRLTTISVALFGLLVQPTWAGGGPENVFLVVNSADDDSKAIANHFADWRKIPSVCVFDIAWSDPPYRTDVETFRQRILMPVLEEMDRRGLSKQIDYIVYSSGFPYGIEYSSDLGTLTDKHSIASITGLTYLHEFVMEKNVEFRNASANTYARTGLGANGGQSHGFRSRYGIDLLGKRVQRGDRGRQYHLSMMLGYTKGEKTNTLREVLSYLQNGVKADGTNPRGTIYYVRNNNIRSKVRDGGFASAAAELNAMGVRAEILEGKNNARDVLPVKKSDVQGAMVGYFKLSWGITGSTILPGAICENFTSYGGIMTGNHTQTLLCHLLSFGAVASSGTVVEPFAIGAKFPNAQLHVHYARGCSVAEAYYQSVLSPYQLLIVGDPLCQPWAIAPRVAIKGINTKKKHSGIIEATISAKSKHAIRNYDVFVDGQMISQLLPDEPLVLDTRHLSNGYHELRVVAIEDTPIETQGRASLGFVCVNFPEEQDSGSDGKPPLVGVTGQLSSKPRDGKLSLGEITSVRVRGYDAREIRLYRGRAELGSVVGSSGRIQIDTKELGAGPVTLQVVAIPKDRKLKPVLGFPLRFEIALPPDREK